MAGHVYGVRRLWEQFVGTVARYDDNERAFRDAALSQDTLRGAWIGHHESEQAHLEEEFARLLPALKEKFDELNRLAQTEKEFRRYPRPVVEEAGT